MAYGYRKSYRRNYRPSTRTHGAGMRSKRLKMPRYPRKRPVKSYVRSNVKQINRLSTSVSRLKAAAFGQKQFQRQIIRSITGLPSQQLGRVSANYPICFLHQAIDENTPIWQVDTDAITGAFIVSQTGAWVNQPFPLATVDPTSIKFDQLKYTTNSLGVQPGYLHMSTSYEFLFTAVNWTGWVEVCQVTQAKTYARQGNPIVDDFQMPSGLCGFVNSALGTGGLQYSPAPWMYRTKVLKRMYFNTSITAVSDLIHTNNQRSFRVILKNDKFRSHIRAQKALTNPNPITNPDIPFNQQDYILIRASNPARQTADSHCAINCVRCPVWRDSVGSS